MTKRLLIIGVDAGSPELFLNWSGRGDLPNLQRLMMAGQTRAVENPYALEAGSVWPVFHTGLMPGRQPQYDGRRHFAPRDYSERWYGAEETTPTLWRQLSEKGLQCLLIDPPYLPVDTRVNGTTIVDWGTHVPADGRTFRLRTHPPETADEVLELVGPDPADGIMCDRRAPETLDEHRRFRDVHLRRIDLKGKLAAHMLRNKEWDVALVTSCDLHCTGHHLWHVNDPTHPRWTPRLEADLGEPMRDCYRAFDRSLQVMLDAVGQDTTVLFFGSHGMGPAYSGTGLLDRILQRLDMGDEERRPPSFAQRARAQARRAWQRLPAEARGRLKPLRKHVRGALRPERFVGDREHRRFFEVLANNATGGVRFNIRGRESRGMLSPAQAQQLTHYLTAELGRITNAETGEPVAADVIATRDLYQGPYADALPDLLVRWNRSAPIRAVRSDTIGMIRHEYADNRTGDHTPAGMCIMRGPGIAAGSIGDRVRTADFAPTIAALFGVTLDDHDGEPFASGSSVDPAARARETADRQPPAAVPRTPRSAAQRD